MHFSLKEQYKQVLASCPNGVVEQPTTYTKTASLTIIKIIYNNLMFK
jgi:hypothetical protein